MTDRVFIGEWALPSGTTVRFYIPLAKLTAIRDVLKAGRRPLIGTLFDLEWDGPHPKGWPARDLTAYRRRVFPAAVQRMNDLTGIRSMGVTFAGDIVTPPHPAPPA